jgi:hypothetical protein
MKRRKKLHPYRCRCIEDLHRCFSGLTEANIEKLDAALGEVSRCCVELLDDMFKAKGMTLTAEGRRRARLLSAGDMFPSTVAVLLRGNFERMPVSHLKAI